MRHFIYPPALTVSTGPDIAVVSYFSVTPEPARGSKERPKDTENVILGPKMPWINREKRALLKEILVVLNQQPSAHQFSGLAH